MSGPPHPSFCASHPQLCARMREALLTALAPRRVSARRLHAAVSERGWEVTAGDMDHVAGLMDEIERRIGANLNSAAGAVSGEDGEAFCRRVRHDLRNTVGALASYLELAADGVREQADMPLADSIERLRGEMIELLDLVDSVVRPR